MADLKTLFDVNSGEINFARVTQRHLIEPEKFELVRDFLTLHGFIDFEFLGAGTSSVALFDQHNPSLVIRLAPDYEVRPVSPYVLQPVYTKDTGIGVKIEFLQNINADHLSEEEVTRLMEAYCKSAKTSGYSIDSDYPQNDGGVFTYDDPEKPGKRLHVFMGADASIVQNDDAPTPPVCTKGYPTLQDQWDEQCRLVENDPRLHALIGGLPPKPLTTRIISSPSSGMRL